MPDTMIVGILLVRDEDLFLERVLLNIRNFCDRIIIADHCSSDDTAQIAKQFCEKHAHAEYHRINDPGHSQELIKKCAGEKVWVFGVDGDELYDTKRLSVLRQQLLCGKYDSYWMLFGNVLNCIEINLEDKTASGYLAPPCRSMTKLYNFHAITSWGGACSERLHGGEVIFKPGYNREMRYEIYKETHWEKAIFRCLHLCFLPRSSKEKKQEGRLMIRKNIADRHSENLFRRIKSKLHCFPGVQEISPLKREKYMRGEIREVNIRSFLL